MPAPIAWRYGRHLGDFEVGRSYAHPWEVTVDEGMVALFAGAFQHATRTYASRAFARQLGFADRPVHPLLAMNLALSFSVHDVSEQCIAHLAYKDMCFPQPLYAGATVRAVSTCLGASENGDGKRGVVHVRTALHDDQNRCVCWFERLALLPAGQFGDRPPEPHTGAEAVQPRPPGLPDCIGEPPRRSFGFGGFFEDYAEGQVYCHQVGKTVSEGEHLMLTSLVRNSHPLHFDHAYCASGGSFTGQRVVMGGLVFAWAASMASRDLGGNEVWDLGYREGAHTGPVHGRDTLYAASKVLSVRPHGPHFGEVTSRLVAVKGAPADGHDSLFEPERDKPKAERRADKVFEVTRTALVQRRPET